MRKINWRKFRPVEVLHIKKVIDITMWSYDQNGKLYKTDNADPENDRPMLFWALAKLVIGTVWWSLDTIQFGFDYDHYVFGWPGKRLSSLPEHEFYWRRSVWLTISDRDAISEHFTRGIF